MSLPPVFAKEIYIRLTEREPAFRCTIRYGGLLCRTAEFRLEEPIPGPENERSVRNEMRVRAHRQEQE
jgi:hypothetical protein